MAKTRIQELKLMKSFISVSKPATEWRNLNLLLIECEYILVIVLFLLLNVLFRYGLMSKCWAASPNERPDFGEIVTIIGDLMDDKVRQVNTFRFPKTSQYKLQLRCL